MTVLRQPGDVNLETKDTRQVGAQVQDATLRVNTPVSVGDTSWRSNLVQSVASTIIKVGEKAIGVAQENAYLEGQAQAGRIKSEEELDSNFMTKDWAIAGYRDTMGKLAMADTEAKMVLDMPDLAQKSPEEMQKYLAERRAKLTPTFSSLSREQRTNMFGQLLLSDRTAITKHNSEHMKYIVDTTAKGIQGQYLADAHSLDLLQQQAAISGNPKDVEAYQLQVEKTAGTLFSSIWNNPALSRSPDVKKKLTTEALQHAIATDNVNLYNFLRDNELPDPDHPNKKSTILSRLDGPELVKLSEQHRASMQRTVAQRHAKQYTVKANMEAEMARGEYQGTMEETEGLANRWLAEGVINGAGKESLMQKFFESKAKGNDLHGLADAALRGDMQYLTNKNKSAGDAYDALDTVWAKQASAGQAVPLHAQIGVLAGGLNNGMAEAGKRIGVRLGPALMQLERADGTMDAQHVQVLQTVNALVDNNVNNPTAINQVLSGMSDAQQTKFLRMRELTKEKPIDIAVRELAQMEKYEATLTPQQKASSATASAKDIITEVGDFDSQGLLMSLWNKVASPFSSRAAAKDAMQPRDNNWFSDDKIANEYAGIMRSEITLEANSLSLTNPGLNAGALVNKAAANVAARTVKTEHGPLFLPRGSDTAKFFGVPSSMSNETVGKALDGLLKPKQDGNRMKFSVGLGGVAYQEFTPDGAPASNSGIIDPKRVRGAVTEVIDKRVQQASEVHGAGKTVVQDGVQVSFNGENTASVSPDLMFKFRSNLVQNEGVRNTVYKDTKGNPTTGIGIANKKYWPEVGPDGRVSRSEIERTFKMASNEAALAGSRAAEATGLTNDNWVLLFSELSYQSGTGFSRLSSYKELVNAARSGDPAAAVQAFKSTPAWASSGESRRKHYTSLLTNAMKG
jgi:GH24 family phage-related lysozyme (muramidase)